MFIYNKKNLTLSTIFVAILFLNGCSSSDSNKDGTNTYIEGDIATDSSIRADSNDIVVMQLEHLSANIGTDDTSIPGTDCVTYNFNKALTTTLTTKAYTPIYAVTLMDNETGEVIASSNPDEDSRSITLEPSTDYSLCLTHDNTYEDQTFFVYFKELESNEPSAVSDLSIYSSNDCPGCDLSGKNLKGSYLNSANLSGANLSGTDLSGANLKGANLSGADLSGSNLSGADLTFANLTDANQTDANLTDAKLGAFVQNPAMIAIFIGKQLATGALQYLGKSLFKEALGDHNPFAEDNPNREDFDLINNKLDIIRADIAKMATKVDRLYKELKIMKNELITVIYYPLEAISTILLSADDYMSIVTDLEGKKEDGYINDLSDLNVSMSIFSNKVNSGLSYFGTMAVTATYGDIYNRLTRLPNKLLPLLVDKSILTIGKNYNYNELFEHYIAMESFLTPLILHQINAAGIVMEANSYFGIDNKTVEDNLKKYITDEVNSIEEYSLLYNAYNLVLRNISIPDDAPAFLPEDATKILERAHYYKSYILNEETNTSNIDLGVHISYISTADMDSAPEKLYARDSLASELSTIYTCDKLRSFPVDGRDYDYWEDDYKVKESREYDIAEYKCENNMPVGKQYYIFSSLEDATASMPDKVRGSFFVDYYDNLFEASSSESSEQKFSYGFALIDATNYDSNFNEGNSKWKLVENPELDTSIIKIKGDANSWPIKIYPDVSEKDAIYWYTQRTIEGEIALKTHFLYNGTANKTMTISSVVNHSFYSNGRINIGVDRASFDLNSKVIDIIDNDKILNNTLYSSFTQGMFDGEEIKDSSSTYSFTAKVDNKYGIEFNMNLRGLDINSKTSENDLFGKINDVKIYIRFPNTDGSINLK